ncbi:MAG: hypothetical protein KAK02_00820 [Desulfobulbaceae bacterium]|nr:hypothetical protein [Desulfobulbaceae bacterium]
MRRNLFSLVLLVVLCSCVASTRGMAPYLQETVTTIQGNVDGIETVMNKQTKEDGLHLTVGTASGPYVVHVCPQWCVEKYDIGFVKGEALTITGSTFSKDGEQNIYAATIVRSNQEVLTLRDPLTGDSLWAGRTRDESLPQKDQALLETKQEEMKEKMQKEKMSSQPMRDGSKKNRF